MNEHTTASEVVWAALFVGLGRLGLALIVVPVLSHLAWMVFVYWWNVV